ncbi:hypothetical protein KEM56_006986 [Ascosphaera pollenicola]|nr:hypothetical protein KEM56_006986 [Ascosphaera pollenicola]
MAHASNPLISPKSSDSGLQILLHPLALLCIAEHITRHVARKRPGPIVGSLLGSQDGRVVSLVNANDVRLITGESGVNQIDDDWFETRLSQYTEVYQNPPLELLGWYTVSPESGPTHEILPIHRHILKKYNQDAVLLAFHPSQMLDPSKQAAGKLPVTVYESVWEDEQTHSSSAQPPASGQPSSLQIRLRELPNSMETDDTEMIAINTLSKGGDDASQSCDYPGNQGQENTLNSKRNSVLNREEEDMISSLQTRLGALNTLNSRLELIVTYLQSVSPELQDGTGGPAQQRGVSRQLLRQTSSLISNLSLVGPPSDSGAPPTTSVTQFHDADMLEILTNLCQIVSDLPKISTSLASYEDSKKRMTMGIKPFALNRMF